MILGSYLIAPTRSASTMQMQSDALAAQASLRFVSALLSFGCTNRQQFAYGGANSIAGRVRTTCAVFAGAPRARRRACGTQPSSRQRRARRRPRRPRRLRLHAWPMADRPRSLKGSKGVRVRQYGGVFEAACHPAEMTGKSGAMSTLEGWAARLGVECACVRWCECEVRAG